MSFASLQEAQSNTGFCSLKGGTKGLDSHGVSDTACCRVREGRGSCPQHISGGCSRSLAVPCPTSAQISVLSPQKVCPSTHTHTHACIHMHICTCWWVWVYMVSGSSLFWLAKLDFRGRSVRCYVNIENVRAGTTNWSKFTFLILSCLYTHVSLHQLLNIYSWAFPHSHKNYNHFIKSWWVFHFANDNSEMAPDSLNFLHSETDKQRCSPFQFKCKMRLWAQPF